jgi:hypothetical protein
MESGFNGQDDWARDEETNTMQTPAKVSIASANIFIAGDLVVIKGPFHCFFGLTKEVGEFHHPIALLPYLIIYKNPVKKEARDAENVFWRKTRAKHILGFRHEWTGRPCVRINHFNSMGNF